MDAIKNGEADIMSLEAGYAYTSFKNRSMKAILSEEYSFQGFHAPTYAAVAVVRKEMCDRNPHLTLENFCHLKTCHPGYQTSGGWNYPVLSLLKLGVDPRLINSSSLPNDVKTVTRFFSASCAPSDLGFATIPANPVMTWNGMKTTKKNATVTALLNANWTSALYTGKNWQNHVLSVSTHALAEVNQLTRSYLSTSGAVSQIIQDLNHNIMIEFSGISCILKDDNCSISGHCYSFLRNPSFFSSLIGICRT
ncbi:hypothetical protein R1flu_001006 [Riccia fluitans]|uniref:Transferrin-like domain-containing protein n=1 Tax=Riccia fluitans TaxID=41844 RepID=A0ABD1Y223_9MARC